MNWIKLIHKGLLSTIAVTVKVLLSINQHNCYFSSPLSLSLPCDDGKHQRYVLPCRRLWALSLLNTNTKSRLQKDGSHISIQLVLWNSDWWGPWEYMVLIQYVITVKWVDHFISTGLGRGENTSWSDKNTYWIKPHLYDL